MNTRAFIAFSLMGLFLIVTGTSMGAETTLPIESSSEGGVSNTVLDTTNGTSPMMVIGIVFAALLVAGAVLLWYLRQQHDEVTAQTESVEVPTELPEKELEDDIEEPSDEELVIELLESNGGRMKQGMIVDETNWSKSKVSMLLSEMEDDELISKLRVGRENIISLPGHEPDAVGSPFDDE